MGKATRESLWLCLEWSPYGADSGIFQRESIEGSGGLRPQNLKQNVKILYKFNVIGGMSDLLSGWSNSYAATKVGEGWLKLGA